MRTSIKNSASVYGFLLLISITGFGCLHGCKGDQRSPRIVATVKVTSVCNAGNTCGTWLASVKKANAVEITNQSFAHYPSLKYEIYPCKGPSPACSPIASFVCNNQQVVTYAGTNLTDGANFYVKLTDTKSTNAEGYNFTNGSFNGQICGNGEVIDPD